MAKHHLLTVEQMYAADQHAVACGVPSLTLMENAGKACADEITIRVLKTRVLVLCGPGNNGGDGFVIARLLREMGWDVHVGLLGNRARLSGDAAAMAAHWTGPCVPLSPELVTDDFGLIVDCLFGAGLSRPIDGDLAELIELVSGSDATVCAIDIPSGIDGNTGAEMGVAIKADFTVTFFREKPGHLLFPGRNHCGKVAVRNIGIPDDAVKAVGALGAHNDKTLWVKKFPIPGDHAHKYTKGHLLVRSGGMTKTGAARLAAMAGLNVGAGLVTVAGPEEAQLVLACHLTAIMIDCETQDEGFSPLIADERRNALVIGPANGVGDRTRAATLAACAGKAALVLDADALTSFKDDPDTLFAALKGRRAPAVLTPHEGEFARLFTMKGCRIDRAKAAAVQSGAIIVLKGPDTIIASPDGRYAINDNAGPELATAGSGDVLAGIVGGLLAQGMPPYEAACAAVWIHGAGGSGYRTGLTAESLLDVLGTEVESIVYWVERGE